MSEGYLRHLLSEEIADLEKNGCTADNWENIKVASPFHAEHVCNVHFSGNVALGLFEKEFTLPGGVKKHSGIRNVTLHNCEIGDNTLIENVHNYISNYFIGDDCFIQNVNVMYVEGRSSFGNNVEVSVLNETGGREVPIYNGLSASLAYLIALYRHRPALILRLQAMIADFAERQTGNYGFIGNHVKIINTGTVRNTVIADYATVENCTRLDNGTVNSNANAPVYIGDSVIAEDFIISSGAVVADAAKIIRCFIGQACHVTHNFSAHDSLLFSNCAFENGEACAIFAGPFTVSMHKSSLLIAGMYSFLNAGSGSNQSNHMYKLGPIHQGIVERGSKTTSDSYVLWPAKIGAFSLVMGRHVRHPDTSKLPFSYLIEKGSESYLVPGVNLKSVGTIRDALKWPKRDNRKDPEHLDMVNFNLLSPYTIQKMLTAIDVLRHLQESSGETSEVYSYQSACIKNTSLVKGINLYSKAINKFLGNSIIKRLENIRFKSDEEIRERLRPDNNIGTGDWLDLSGLIAPKSEIDRLINQIESEEIKTLEPIQQTFISLHKRYYDLEWAWAYEVMQSWYHRSIGQITAQDITEIVNIWKDAVVSLDEMLYADAKKEFSMTAKTGFGIDGNTQQKNVDFEQVRGAFENNPFVKTVNEHIKAKTELGNELIDRIAHLAN